jgi:hypothetical protein
MSPFDLDKSWVCVSENFAFRAKTSNHALAKFACHSLFYRGWHSFAREA